MDRSHNTDQGDNRQELQKSDHVAKHSAGGQIREAAHMGREIAAMVRQMNATDTQDVHHVNLALARLLQAPASTAADALAFAVTARTLMPLAFELIPDGENPIAVQVINELVVRTVETLERVARVKSETYTGQGPTVN